jgi:putative ABC transport system permease protein
MINLTRVPGRAALGAASLAVGVCGLTFLLATTIAFHDLLVGTLLGQAVSVQATSSEYVADISIIALGVAGAADVVFLNLRDRASELATLRALGWDEHLLRRLVTYEGALLGLLGSLAGGIVGLTTAAVFARALPSRLIATTAIALGIGALLAAAAAAAVATTLRMLPTGELLAGE